MDDPAQAVSETDGYLSKEAKKTFTITAGVLGAIFFLAQFIVPFLVMMITMPTMMASTVFSMKVANLKNGASWNGKVWYPESSVPFGETGSTNAALMSAAFDEKQEPEQIADLPFVSPRLLADTDRLWVIDSNKIGYFQKGQLIIYPDVKTLGDISRPFLHKGMPAVIENRPEGQAFMTFQGNDWREEYIFQIYAGEKLCCIDHLQIISENDRLHIFLKYGGSLYYREGLQYTEGTSEEVWQAIAPAGSSWYSLMVEGRPAVFIHTQKDNPMITGYRKRGDRWEQFLTHQQFIVSDLGAFEMEGEGKTALITQSFPGSLNLLVVEGQNVVRTIKQGKSGFFPKNFMMIMFIPQSVTMAMPLILAVIFSVLMRKYRISHHRSGSEKKPFASLTRRALSQIVDAIILAAPLITVLIMFSSVFFDADNPFTFMKTGFVNMIGLTLGAFLWAIICIVIFSLMEGLRGVTPGKWVFGIRVLGTDLEYCGFWRALIRNLLKFVDGFFNFMVGVMVVALSEHWQRVGDMAARTVVVDVRKG